MGLKTISTIHDPAAEVVWIMNKKIPYFSNCCRFVNPSKSTLRGMTFLPKRTNLTKKNETSIRNGRKERENSEKESPFFTPIMFNPLRTNRTK